MATINSGNHGFASVDPEDRRQMARIEGQTSHEDRGRGEEEYDERYDEDEDYNRDYDEERPSSRHRNYEDEEEKDRRSTGNKKEALRRPKE